MSTETTVAKAHRYLTQGRLDLRVVSPACVKATVRGDTDEHLCGWNGFDGWWCECPATSRRCSHLIALRLCVLRDAADLRRTVRP